MPQTRINEKAFRKWLGEKTWYELHPEQIDTNVAESILDKDDWQRISRNKLTLQFIEQWAEYVDWFDIAEVQSLNEDFIERHAERITSYEPQNAWYQIFLHQSLSETFKQKYMDRLDSKVLEELQEEMQWESKRK